jgi:hypothetical protein
MSRPNSNVSGGKCVYNRGKFPPFGRWNAVKIQVKVNPTGLEEVDLLVCKLEPSYNPRISALYSATDVPTRASIVFITAVPTGMIGCPKMKPRSLLD